MKKYSEDHVWIEPNAETGVSTVGITRYAQETLGEIVTVDLPAVGQLIAQRAPGGVVESTKTAADVHMPVDVEVVALNEDAVSNPESVSNDPEGTGWLLRVRIVEPAQIDALMSEAAYRAFA